MMRHLGIVCAVVVISLGAICASALAQAAAAPADRPVLRAKGEVPTSAEILEGLNSKDAGQYQAALDVIRQRLPNRGLQELRASYLRPMLANKQYKDVAELALEGILANPWDTRSIENVLAIRIDALLAMGQAEQALMESRSLFNIATMLGTSEAILTVAKCINAARPDDVALFNTFREEQMAGAAAPAADAPVRKCTVLEGIKINAAPYEAVLKTLHGEDAQSMMARGNLLLLSARTAEAKVIFDRLYSLSGAELADVSEALARVMKAEDGTIGRANAWVLSIRPKKTAN